MNAVAKVTGTREEQTQKSAATATRQDHYMGICSSWQLSLFFLLHHLYGQLNSISSSWKDFFDGQPP